MLPEIQPMDIGVISMDKGYPWYYWAPHKMIKWRGLEDAVHVVTFKNSQGDIWNPIFAGVKSDNISKYKGYHITIHRYNKYFNVEKIVNWCNQAQSESEGYDFWRQWILGFVLGFTTKSIANNPKRWTCAEWPYWAFQENGHEVTLKDEVLPMPRLFRFHSDFPKIYEGVV